MEGTNALVDTQDEQVRSPSRTRSMIAPIRCAVLVLCILAVASCGYEPSSVAENGVSRKSSDVSANLMWHLCYSPMTFDPRAQCPPSSAEVRRAKLLAREQTVRSKVRVDSSSATRAINVHEYTWGDAYYTETTRLEITPNQGPGPNDQPPAHSQEFQDGELTIRSSLGGFVWREHVNWRRWSVSNGTEVPLPLPDDPFYEPHPRIASFDNPPFSESGSQSYHLELQMSKPLSAFGFEVQYEEPLNVATVSYYKDTALVYQRVAPFDPDEPTLVAVKLDGATFNRVVLDGVGNWLYFANFRYVLGDDLSVLCSPSTLDRGALTDCQMTVRGPGAVTARSWRFDNPAVDREYLESVPSPTTAQWAGEMGVSGTVWAFATIAGRRDSASTTITVRDRDWVAAGLVADRVPSVTVGPVEPPVTIPSTGEDLGNAYNDGTYDNVCVEPKCRFIASGPNGGLGIYYQHPFSVTGHFVELNYTAFAAGSLWRQSFPLTQVNGRCARGQVPASLQSMIEMHEGTNVEAHRDSHTRIWRDAFDTLGARMFERVVIGGGIDHLRLFRSVRAMALTESAMIDDPLPNSPGGLRNPAKLPCKLFLP